MEDGKVRIEKFDGKDFGFWKMQIGDYLYQKNLYQSLEEKKLDSMSVEDWNLLDMQTLVIRMIDGGVSVVCWNCGGKGHLKKECPNLRDRGGNHNGKASSSGSVNSASDGDDEVYGDVLLLDVGSTKLGHTELGEMCEQRMEGLALGSGSDAVRKKVTFMDAGDRKLVEAREAGGVSSPIKFLW